MTADRQPAGWAAARLLQVLAESGLASRLSRGRAAAARGAVRSLEVIPGVVAARVAGDREEPFAARLEMRPCSELAWARIEIALAEQAISTARLLAGELPRDLEETFTHAGSTLLPRSASEWTAGCDCPDWERPCEHIAALAYRLVDAVEADPFLLLRWRGRDREALLQRLRVLRSDLGEADLPAAGPSGGPGPGAPPGGTGVGAASVLAASPSGAADPDTVERFWFSPVPLPARPAVVDGGTAAILRQLPAPPDRAGGPGLIDRLRPAYEAFAAAP